MIDMKKEDIESKAKRAIELVHGIDDDFKTVAFSVIFGRMLDADDGPVPLHLYRSRTCRTWDGWQLYCRKIKHVFHN